MALEDDLKDDISWLLSLKDNFDDEGSLAPKKENIDKAVKFAKIMTTLVKSQLHIDLAKPSLGPCGLSVDAWWKNYEERREPKKAGEYEILLNVPLRDATPTYYAEIFTDRLQVYKGSLPEDAKELIER